MEGFRIYLKHKHPELDINEWSIRCFNLDDPLDPENVLMTHPSGLKYFYKSALEDSLLFIRKKLTRFTKYSKYTKPVEHLAILTEMSKNFVST